MTFISKIKTWAEMIKIEHTVFSAPFMLSSMLLASGKNWPSAITFFWCAIALLGARSAAMSLNRLIDWRIDALNPRTANRPIPSGKISPQTTLWLSILGFGLLALAALNLPKICLYLLPVAVLWLSFYSYCKRFTWLCHWVLGIALGGAVLGGWIAVSGKVEWTPIILASAVALWVAGFDILYALQDLDFDKKNNLFSVPTRFGMAKSLWIARICHLACLILFIWCGFWLKALGQYFMFGYWVACVIALLGLVQQHIIIARDQNKIEAVFFTANALISSLFFVCILTGKLISYNPVQV